MPYPVDLAGKPAPWTLPTKDALTIGAEYFDNVSGHSLLQLLLACTSLLLHNALCAVNVLATVVTVTVSYCQYRVYATTLF
jgi:hypothetical protein